MKRESLLWKGWERTARRLGERTVIIEAATGQTWSANALNERVLDWAEQLPAHRAGERIAFRLPNGPDWLALFLALQRKGLAAMPLDGGLPGEACFDTARRFGARALYLDGKFHSIDGEKKRLRRCCLLKITSGSAGLPKAVECRADHLIADGTQIIKTMCIRPSDRNLAAIPLGHSYGLGNLVMPLLLQGTSLVTVADYLPRQLVEWIGEYRVTVFPGVPALFRVLSSLPTGPQMAPLRKAISAAAVLSPEIARAFFERYGIKLHNFYGSSETGGICYDRTGAASLAGRSVGKPLAGVSIKVGRGRIEVASRAVATTSGRWKMPDRGEWNSRGELVLHGRIGQQANIGGKKVHPAEIERLLRALPRVTDAAVWLEQKQGRDWLVAAVETPLDLAKIEQALAAKLPAWKLPKSYLIAAELPRTARGKLDRVALENRSS